MQTLSRISVDEHDIDGLQGLMDKWMMELDRIPAGLVHDTLDDCGWSDLTVCPVGRKARIHTECPASDRNGNPVNGIVRWNHEEGSCGYGIVCGYCGKGGYVVRIDGGTEIELEHGYVETSEDRALSSILPEMDWLYSFRTPYDNAWLECLGIPLFSEYGFRILHHEKYGYFFGTWKVPDDSRAWRQAFMACELGRTVNTAEQCAAE